MSEAVGQASARGSSQIALLGVVALPLVGMVLFLLALSLGVRGPDIPIVGLAILTGSLAVTPVIIDNVRPPLQRHLLLSLFSLSFIPFFVVPVFFDYLLLDPLKDRINPMSLVHLEPRHIVGGQLTALVAILAVLAGYASPVGRMLARALPGPRVDWRPVSTLGVAIVMIPFGWVIFLSSEFGLLPRNLGGGIFGVFSAWSYLGFSLLTISYLRYRYRPALVLAIAMIPPAMAFNFITGSKGLFLTPPAMVAISYIFHHRSIGVKWMLAGFAAIVMLYPLAEFYRWNIQQSGGLRIEEFVANPSLALTMMARFVSDASLDDWVSSGLGATLNRFNGLVVLSRIVRDVPEVVPYQGGWSLGYIVISYVPRLLWPSKPEVGSIGRFITEKFGPGEGFASATGPTWIGDLYMNFGYLGVIPGMLVIGLFFRLLHENVFRAKGTIPAFLAGVVTLFVAAKGLQSSVLGLVNGIAFNLGLLILIHMAVRFLSSGQAQATAFAARRAQGAPTPPAVAAPDRAPGPP